jgi:tRNA uridine 5-carboxymethylaminomethyl modification enzyme
VKQSYSILVIGGGHAGLESALISAHKGCSTLIVTQDPSAIGRVSCNPAIGGLAKGQMVREIDALGGKMGLFSDFSGIQFKVLNQSKGRSVWSPRAQVDKRV